MEKEYASDPNFEPIARKAYLEKWIRFKKNYKERLNEHKSHSFKNDDEYEEGIESLEINNLELAYIFRYAVEKIGQKPFIDRIEKLDRAYKRASLKSFELLEKLLDEILSEEDFDYELNISNTKTEENVIVHEEWGKFKKRIDEKSPELPDEVPMVAKEAFAQTKNLNSDPTQYLPPRLISFPVQNFPPHFIVTDNKIDDSIDNHHDTADRISPESLEQRNTAFSRPQSHIFHKNDEKKTSLPVLEIDPEREKHPQIYPGQNLKTKYASLPVNQKKLYKASDKDHPYSKLNAGEENQQETNKPKEAGKSIIKRYFFPSPLTRPKTYYKNKAFTSGQTPSHTYSLTISDNCIKRRIHFTPLIKKNDVSTEKQEDTHSLIIDQDSINLRINDPVKGSQSIGKTLLVFYPSDSTDNNVDENIGDEKPGTNRSAHSQGFRSRFRYNDSRFRTPSYREAQKRIEGKTDNKNTSDTDYYNAPSRYRNWNGFLDSPDIKVRTVSNPVKKHFFNRRNYFKPRKHVESPKIEVRTSSKYINHHTLSRSKKQQIWTAFKLRKKQINKN